MTRYRRWRALAKQRWAVRWIGRHRMARYHLSVTRLYGELAPIYQIDWTSEAICEAEALIGFRRYIWLGRELYPDDEQG